MSNPTKQTKPISNECCNAEVQKYHISQEALKLKPKVSWEPNPCSNLKVFLRAFLLQSAYCPTKKKKKKKDEAFSQNIFNGSQGVAVL